MLSEAEYQQWLVQYTSAECDLVNREGRMSECADNIERELQLLGDKQVLYIIVYG